MLWGGDGGEGVKIGRGDNEGERKRWEANEGGCEWDGEGEVKREGVKYEEGKGKKEKRREGNGRKGEEGEKGREKRKGGKIKRLLWCLSINPSAYLSI